MVPQFKTREEYECYAAKRRAAYESAPAKNRTTSGPPISLEAIRRFQKARGVPTAPKRK